MVEVKTFRLLKRPFLTKKRQWFFVTLRGGGGGGGRASGTFVTKKMVFFNEGFPYIHDLILNRFMMGDIHIFHPLHQIEV